MHTHMVDSVVTVRKLKQSASYVQSRQYGPPSWHPELDVTCSSTECEGDTGVGAVRNLIFISFQIRQRSGGMRVR